MSFMKLLTTELMCRLSNEFGDKDWTLKIDRLNYIGAFRVYVDISAYQNYSCCCDFMFSDYFCEYALNFEGMVSDHVKKIVSSIKEKLSKNEQNKESEN